MTLSVLDRFDALFTAGQRIARSRSASEVRDALCDGAQLLLGAEHCAVVELAGAPPQPAGAGIALQSLMSAVVRTGQPAIWDGAPPDPAVRSALCAPLVVHGGAVAVLWATHAARVAVFGDDERRIAGFLAQIAGAALEHATELAATGAALDDSQRQVAAIREQLLHAGRMAAVGTLFAGLTHELNNPLSVIVGNVDNLRNLAPPGEPVARVIDAIDRQAARAVRLVSALLRFSHTGAVGREEVPPGELIQLVVDLLAAEARRREIDLRVALAEGLAPLFVIRHEVESALVNITTNALQATPVGGTVELSVFAEARDAVAGVRFEARDTGVGIAPEILPQIFDPFFTTKPEGEGTGLGLSLAREIASTHGGQLWVESTPGQGTTMSLWLPERGNSPRPRRSTPIP
jgi:signal transduction histidine kinase